MFWGDVSYYSDASSRICSIRDRKPSTETPSGDTDGLDTVVSSYTSSGEIGLANVFLLLGK